MMIFSNNFYFKKVFYFYIDNYDCICINVPCVSAWYAISLEETMAMYISDLICRLD